MVISPHQGGKKAKLQFIIPSSWAQSGYIPAQAILLDCKEKPVGSHCPSSLSIYKKLQIVSIQNEQLDQETITENCKKDRLTKDNPCHYHYNGTHFTQGVYLTIIYNSCVMIHTYQIPVQYKYNSNTELSTQWALFNLDIVSTE